MMRDYFWLLLLFQLAGQLHAAPGCNGSATMLVPAVVGDGSGLINFSARLIPGSGQVFLSAVPETGTSTQQSVQDAAQYAFTKAGADNCDAVIRIDTAGSASYVEGPSAGASLTVLTYGALEGVEPRRDAVLTGTIDPEGNVGPVGGLYEKALAATIGGATYFVTPPTSFFEVLMLREIRDTYGLQVLEAGNADEAISFMLYNGTLHPPNLSRSAEPVPNLPRFDDSGMPGFDGVTGKIISLENGVVTALPEKDNDSAAVKSFYGSEVQRQGGLRSTGYLFTAANEAFLDYVDVSTVSAILAGNSDVTAKQAEVRNCLSSLPVLPKTGKNFEWLIGADLRKTWAENKLNATPLSKGLLEEKYVTYRELAYAEAWCRVSGILGEGAGNGGSTIDESAWKGLASAKISEAEKLGTLESDSQDHLDSARASYAKGGYGAALFDAVYAVEMHNAGADLGGMKGQQADYEIGKMLSTNRTSLWGSIYQSHGAYLASPNVSDKADAYKILRYAIALDNATAQLRLAAAPPAPAVPGAPDTLLIASIFIIIIVLLVYLYYRMSGKRRSDGRNTDTKRPYRLPRAGQKQG